MAAPDRNYGIQKITFIEFPYVWLSNLNFVEWVQSNVSFEMHSPSLVPLRLCCPGRPRHSPSRPPATPLHTGYLSLLRQFVLWKYDGLSMWLGWETWVKLRSFEGKALGKGSTGTLRWWEGNIIKIIFNLFRSNLMVIRTCYKNIFLEWTIPPTQR